MTLRVPVQLWNYLRATAYTWMACGRLGTSQLPHVFMAARSYWALDKDRMRYVETELATIQTVPGGRIEDFCNYLLQFEKRIKDKNPTKILLLADITRSLEVIPAVWKKTPDAIPVVVTTAPRDEWSFPTRLCGRPLLMSRLQVWISEKKIISALPDDDDDDPNVWPWTRVKSALGSISSRPIKVELDELVRDDAIYEDIALAISMIPWWAEMEQPSIFEETPRIDQN